MKGYCWLSPDAPGALALCQVPRLAALLDKPLPAPGRACLARVCDAKGKPADEAVVLGHAEHLELHCHGGHGVRQAVNAALASHGLSTVQAEADPAWERWASVVHPAAIPFLAQHTLPPGCDESRLSRPFQILVCGRANAGKSTLVNAWCGHQRTLVSATPGTTRDLVWVDIQVQGWALRLADSAGLHGTEDTLDQAGQALVLALRNTADRVLWLEAPDAVGSAEAESSDLIIFGKGDARATWPQGLAWASPQAVGEARSAQLLAAIEQRLLADWGLA